MLRVSAFPCVALILPASPRPVLVACVCGLTPATRLVRLLGAAMEAHGEPLAAARRDAAQRAHGRALRAEQDAALAASLAEDRQREEARAEAERARAAAEADARHLEAEAAAEAAVREAAAVAAAEAAEALRLARAAALRPEPAAGSVGCVAVLLRLPDGGRLQRRFDPQVDTAESLYGWAEATGVAPGFSLVTSFPRSVLPRGERTLADVGVTAQAALLVERL